MYTSSINSALKIALGLSILFGLVAGWNYFQLPRAERNFFDSAYHEQADPSILVTILGQNGMTCEGAQWLEDSDFSERAVRCKIGNRFIRISQFERPSAVMQAISSEAIAPKCSVAKRMRYLYSGLSIIRSSDERLISRINKVLTGITFTLRCRDA